MQQTLANSSQLNMAVVSRGTRQLQQQRTNRVQQPQPRQEECPGDAVGGGVGGAQLFMETDPSNSVKEILSSNIGLGEHWSGLVYPDILKFSSNVVFMFPFS